MAVFVLSPADQDRLREAMARAVAAPISLDSVRRMAGIATKDSAGVVRGDRPQGFPEPQRVDLPHGWRVAISVEQQPPGLFLHVSISSPTPKRTLARPEAVQMLLDALGCKPATRGWVEEFKDDGVVAGNAVNVLVPL